MAKNPFRFGKGNEGPKDYFSSSFFTSKPNPEVDEKQALSIPSVKAAVELISNSIGQLPIHLYVEDEINESVVKVENDPRIGLLNHSANKYDTAQTLKKKIVQDYLLRGKSYIYQKDDGSLYLLPAKNVLENVFTEDYISIVKKEYIFNGMQTLTLDESQVLIIDSGTQGILYDNGQLLQIAIGQLDYQKSLMDSSAVPTGVLKASSRLTENAINRLRTSFEGLYSGAKKAGKTIILEEGLDFSQLSLSPDQLQLIESNKQMISEIARIFNLPESKINASAQKYASLEQDNLSFLTGCIGPIITAIESALDKQLLSEVEKKLGFYFRFNTEELLRTTDEQKMKFISNGFKDGILSMNESRHRLDLEPVEKDFYLLSIGQVMKYEDGSLVNLNMVGQPNNPQEVKSQNGNGNKS